MKVIVRVVPLVVLAVLQLAAPAFATFPGANGLLAVAPRAGGGIVLVGANGSGARRICVARCGTPAQPRWSPDGRAIVFAGRAGGSIKIVYPDGSCMNCTFGAAPNPAFRPGGAVISFIQYAGITLDGIDGIRQRSAPAGAASDAVWSDGGLLAVVRGGAVWAGPPGALRFTGKGTEPSWSPDGNLIAASQAGWVVILRVGHRGARRLVRGSAPAFSPDGRLIAFVAPDHRLMIVAVGARRPTPKAVGTVQAVSVDWQPRPQGPNPGCPLPPGARTLASSSGALVIGDGFRRTGPEFTAPLRTYMGCLRADGRQRLLESLGPGNIDNAYSVSSTTSATS